MRGYTRDLIHLRQEIKLLGDDVWWEKERVGWLNAEGEPMSELCWHNRSAKAMQIVLDNEWLLLINAKRSQQIFNLPQGSWQLSCVPSEKFNYNQDGKLTVEHMGIWILQRKNTSPNI